MRFKSASDQTTLSRNPNDSFYKNPQDNRQMQFNPQDTKVSRYSNYNGKRPGLHWTF